MSDTPRRKRRTREHVIEDLSENHLERFVLLKGHVLRRPERDYGVDVTMFHFATNGEIENGEVRFQLKASESLKVISNGSAISLPIKTGDLHYWSLEVYPFVLVVFDVKTDTAYWLHIQECVSRQPELVDPDKETVHLHIPLANKLNVNSIDDFRRKSLATVDNLRNQGGYPDASRPPK
ncbi:DUF4365 domain-containing protein [Aeoliella sp. ICT_H6.2]|uniref:DUF4365 domain-containing protein n=1 Tax=Aeoliella straminimaris TaxID=2954799 RepID=A0A9X2FHB8_9BACT|nr:DUF4365 domain-containing protein [Aeoliella straminimaris]MCO6045846.1 DUF4365 domain-containing protein [Aeoliella straminimaris]